MKEGEDSRGKDLSHVPAHQKRNAKAGHVNVRIYERIEHVRHIADGLQQSGWCFHTETARLESAVKLKTMSRASRNQLRPLIGQTCVRLGTPQSGWQPSTTPCHAHLRNVHWPFAATMHVPELFAHGPRHL